MSQKNYKYLNNEPEYAPQSKITAHMILIYEPCLGCSKIQIEPRQVLGVKH